MTFWGERNQSHVFQFTATSVQVCLISNKVRDLCCSEWEACSYHWFSVWRICYGPYWCIFISLMCYLVSMSWIAYSHSAWILLIRYRDVSGSSTGRSTVYRESDFCRFFSVYVTEFIVASSSFSFHFHRRNMLYAPSLQPPLIWYSGSVWRVQVLKLLIIRFYPFSSC